MSTDRVSSEVAMLAEGVSSDNSKVDRYKVPSDVAMLADKAVDRCSTVSRFRVPSAAAVQHTAYRSSHVQQIWRNVALLTGYYCPFTFNYTKYVLIVISYFDTVLLPVPVYQHNSKNEEVFNEISSKCK